MGYFANGEVGRWFEAVWCNRCVHGQDEVMQCPVMALHEMWNYEQHPEIVKTPKEKALAGVRHEALETFIDSDSYECRMFYRHEKPERPEYPFLPESKLKPLVSEQAG